MFRPLSLALSFMTILPVPIRGPIEEADLRQSATFFPWVGAGLGLVLWSLWRLFSLALPPLVASTLAVAAYLAVTGAIHLDGLMDTADAIASRQPANRALEVMRDSRVGAVGAAFGCVILVGKTAALGHAGTAPAAVFAAVPAVSRLAIVWSMALSSGARPTGLGAVYAKRLSPGQIGISTLSVATGLALAMPIGIALAGLAASFAVTVSFTAFVRRRFGGTTGDTFGALNELVEWLGFSALAGLMAH